MSNEDSRELQYLCWIPLLIEIKNCHKKRATDGIRTRGLHLGKVALYQLSYYRMSFIGRKE